MTIEPIYGLSTIQGPSVPRHRVWLTSAELDDGETEGTYVLTDESAAAQLGTGSEIYVVDQPGTVLLWDGAIGAARKWTPGA